jgi:hypothetical protein
MLNPPILIVTLLDAPILIPLNVIALNPNALNPATPPPPPLLPIIYCHQSISQVFVGFLRPV